MVASSEAMTAFTAFTSTAAISARCVTRLVLLNAVLMGFTAAALFAGAAGAADLAAFFAGGAFLAGPVVFFAVAIECRVLEVAKCPASAKAGGF